MTSGETYRDLRRELAKLSQTPGRGDAQRLRRGTAAKLAREGKLNKLTATMVREIRERYAGGQSQLSLVRWLKAEYDITITQPMLSYIVNRKKWKETA